MNVRLRYDLVLKAAIWYDDCFQVNNYTMSTELMTNTVNQEEHVIALNRLKHLVYQELDSSVFVKYNQTSAIKKLTAAGLKLSVLPEEPVDQVIGLLLFEKFNAIMEQRILVKSLDLASDLGDNIHYCHSDLEMPIDFGHGWWQDSTPNHSIEQSTGSKKVVKIQRGLCWSDFDLDWTNQVDQETGANSVVKFNRHENQ